MYWFEPPSQLINWEFNSPKVLEDSTIDFMHEYANAHPLHFQKAEIKNDAGAVDDEYRRTDILFLTDMDKFKNLYNHITHSVLEANRVHFKFALNYVEALQYSVYKSSNLGYYNIHSDSYLRNTNGFNRKVSFTILLDDPEDFEGGDLLLHTTEQPIKAELKKGDMFLFPSFVPHSVTPVTKGVRRSLVGWVCGPNFV